jgi:hypothetical protein
MVFEACPISSESRNEVVVRLVAAFVVIISAASIAAGPHVAPWVFLALAADFVVRGFAKPKYSPLATLARGVANTLKLAPKPVDAAPKRFAARVGVVFTIAACALYLGGAPLAGSIVAGVLITCAVLESVFAICVGCTVYSLLPAPVARALAR